MNSKNVGFIGAGNMSSALIKGIIQRGVCNLANIFVSSPSGPGLLLQNLGVNCTKDNKFVFESSDVIVLAVKPFKIYEALQTLSGSTPRKECIIISVASGVSLDLIQNMITNLNLQTNGNPLPAIFRVMPNTPAQVLVGASGMCTFSTVDETKRALVRELFEAVGKVQAVEEKHMDAVCGLSGSGPAFVMLFIEALADGAVASGLPRPAAMSLALQVVKGAATMAQETGLHPGVLKDAVASPGGTTIAGIHALEVGGFRGSVMSAVINASKRSAELGEIEDKKVGALLGLKK